jgi:hypothetical protein
MSSSSTTTTRGSALKWSDLLNESVHTDDDHDIGDIEAVNREFVVIKRGFVNVHRYFIPAEKIAGWDGNVLWLKITEEEVKRKYQNDHATPEPSRYLTKDYANYYSYGVYPPIGWIPIRYAVPTYSVPTTTQQPIEYKCDLCGTTFRDDNELSQHVKTNH